MAVAERFEGCFWWLSRTCLLCPSPLSSIHSDWFAFSFKNVVIFSRKQQVDQGVFNNLFCIVQHTGGWMGTMDRYTDAVEYLTKKDDKTVKSLRSRMNGCRRTRERDRTVQRSDPDTSVIKKPPERCVSCKSLYWRWQQCGLAGATSGPGCGVLLSLYFGGL